MGLDSLTDLPRITVVSVSWRSANLLGPMLARLCATADHPDAIQILLADNTNGADAELAALNYPVVAVDTAGERMSMAHAIGLNALMSNLKTPYTLIVDPDTAILARGWDSLLVAGLAEPQTVAIGAPYPGWRLGKYHDFPSPPFAFWRSEALRALDPDWRPYERTVPRRLRDFALRQVFWLPRVVDRYVLHLPDRRFQVGRWMERVIGVVSKDTGWEIAQRARQRGWRAALFQTMYADDDLPSVFRALAAEFELYTWQGQPIVTHQNPTRTQLGMNLWTTKNVTLYQDRFDRAAQAERWLALVNSLDAQ